MQIVLGDFGLDVEVTLDPPKDGNCQFSCLEEQLKILGYSWSQASLRLEITEWLRCSNLNEVSESVPDCDLEKYLIEMEKPTSFGDNITLLAVARKFRLQIIVLSSQGRLYTRVISPDSSDIFNLCTPTVLLGYYPENCGAHYVSLRPREGCTVEEIVHSRKAVATRLSSSQDNPTRIVSATLTQPSSTSSTQSLTVSLTQPLSTSSTQSLLNSSSQPLSKYLTQSLSASSTQTLSALANRLPDWPDVWNETQWRDKQQQYTWLDCRKAKLG